MKLPGKTPWIPSVWVFCFWSGLPGPASKLRWGIPGWRGRGLPGGSASTPWRQGVGSRWSTGPGSPYESSRTKSFLGQPMMQKRLKMQVGRLINEWRVNNCIETWTGDSMTASEHKHTSFFLWQTQTSNFIPFSPVVPWSVQSLPCRMWQ